MKCYEGSHGGIRCVLLKDISKIFILNSFGCLVSFHSGVHLSVLRRTSAFCSSFWFYLCNPNAFLVSHTQPNSLYYSSRPGVTKKSISLALAHTANVIVRLLLLTANFPTFIGFGCSLKATKWECPFCCKADAKRSWTWSPIHHYFLLFCWVGAT